MGSGRQSNGQTRTAKQPEVEKIPALCQFWRTLAKSLPRLTIGGLDVSLTIASTLSLAAVRFAAEYLLLEGIFGWPVNSLVTKSAAASIGAITHSLQLVPALIVCFLHCRSYNPSEKLKDAPVWWQESVTALLQFCTSYMIYDGVLNILWLKSRMQEGGVSSEDLMFLGHHLATSLYMTSARLQGAGHQSAMICMLLGELTNPFHNTYLILESAQQLDCCNGELSQKAFEVVHVAFAALYCLLRMIVGPIILGHATVNLWLRGRRHIHVALILVWTLLIWAVMIGSIPWMIECYGKLEEYGFPSMSSFVSYEHEAKAEL